MEDFVKTPTEYLESRIRERRAHVRGPLSTFTPSGKDSDVFTFDFDHRNRTYNSSPMSHAPSRVTSNSRAQSSRTTVSSHTRDLGARQAEQQIEKLSKENFDLKLELYHRRHKYTELEKRLQTLEAAGSEVDRLQEENQSLRSDNADLHQINSDATAVIDHQEEAIDEAVVKIIELEELVRRLQQQHPAANTVPLLKVPKERGQTAAKAQENSRTVREDETHPQEPPQARVEKHDEVPDVQTPGTVKERSDSDPDQPPHVPAFLRSREPSTSALRAIFMEGETLVREIPSHASLVSSPSRKDFTSYDGSPRSPQLSVLSESDFKSIYGRETPRPKLSDARLEDLPSSPETPVQWSKRNKYERTTRWVSDRAVSPTASERSIALDRSNIPLPSVETPQPDPRVALDGTAPISSALSALIAPSSTPRPKVVPATGVSNRFLAPTFGAHHLPPTPDTMVTRQTSHSPTSIIRDRSSQDALEGRESISHLDRIMQLQKEAEMLARERSLPQHYEEIDEFLHRPDTAEDFGAALFRHEAYESSIAPAIPRHGRPSYPVVADEMRSSSTAPSFQTARQADARSSTPVHTPRQSSFSGTLPNGSPSLPNQQPVGPGILRPQTTQPESRHNLRRNNSVDLDSPPGRRIEASSPPRPRQTSIRFALPQRPLSWHQAAPEGREVAEQSSGPAGKARDTASTSTPPKLIPFVEAANSQTSTPSHQRAPSIRERMLKFAHRSSISAAASGSAQAGLQNCTKNTPEPNRRRFFARRSSSSAPRPLPSRPGSRGKDSKVLESNLSDESLRVGHMSAIMAAANAAAPYLSFDINPRSRPISTATTPSKSTQTDHGDAPKPPAHSNASTPARSPYVRNTGEQRPRGLSASRWGAEEDLTPVKPKHGAGPTQDAS